MPAESIPSHQEKKSFLEASTRDLLFVFHWPQLHHMAITSCSESGEERILCECIVDPS